MSSDTMRPDGFVDTHAHFFPADLPVPPSGADARWPVLRPDAPGAVHGAIYQGDAVFRKVSHELWDVDARITSLDDHGIAQQLISPVPVMLTTWADPVPAAAFAREMNDGIAAAVQASGGRLAGLAGVPLQDVDLATAELERAVREQGLVGVEIGTRVEDQELDDPALAPFFEAAADLGAAIFVHPMDGGTGVVRRAGQPYDFGLGMLTDTALAATALLTGGVLERHPDLRIGFAHGCGSLAWAAPRLSLGLSVWGEPGTSAEFDELVRRLWVDTLVLDSAHLPLLVHRFGAEHVMVGTDAPFIPSQLTGLPDLLRGGLEHGLRPDDIDAIAGANGLAFFTRED